MPTELVVAPNREVIVGDGDTVEVTHFGSSKTTKTYWDCQRCGASVWDRALHDDFHKKLDD